MAKKKDDEQKKSVPVEKETESKKYGGVIPGTILIILGILFLLPRLGVDFGNLWPTFLLAPGLAFVIYYFLTNKIKNNAGILIPGMILIFLSAFFYWQAYSTWANSDKLWPVYPLAVGLAFYISYLAGGRVDKGALIPANILTAVGVLFLILNYYSFNLWPLILIIIGLAIILSSMRKNHSSE
jgi:hypothetical protein